MILIGLNKFRHGLIWTQLKGCECFFHDFYWFGWSNRYLCFDWFCWVGWFADFNASFYVSFYDLFYASFYVFLRFILCLLPRFNLHICKSSINIVFKISVIFLIFYFIESLTDFSFLKHGFLVWRSGSLPHYCAFAGLFVAGSAKTSFMSL